ncbi:MAG: asparagine synthase (glutamine-hydrolyzing) [Flavobacteriales bacterium]|nr:asparagine synthase (glutamine-hydrolyzing) [Flavobacteriales bacterium]MCX7768247.1 asparagine synthase (glutamine-hydrolyzing) [Flavobacteriales bacterium]MDW8410592.1 asparagine synthase (glutamine-hydrolyzing) [Flavobacteriales bacterium]
MCGFTGFVSSYLTEETLRKSTNSLKHRGPDAEGYFFERFMDRAVGLGHRRLSILDLSEAANQPFHSADGRFVMVYNGEVYNFRELKNKYHLITRTTSDTEVVLELFARYGPEAIKELNGMFAMAIFDKKEKTIYCFRDRFGIKPFFYYWDGNQFIFASELKAITQILDPAPTINKSAIAYYLNLGFIPYPITIYNDIYKLSPGYQLTLSLDDWTWKEAPYVRLADFILPETVRDADTAIRNTEQLLLKSVERQIISDVPLGIFLSGGTDSSLLTALAREVSPDKVKTFSLGFTDSLYDELPFARKVAAYLGTEHYEMVVSDKELLDNVEFIMASYDEPYIISAGFSAFVLSAFTRRYVKVALSGEGADELFLGYGFYTWARRLNTFPLRQIRRPLSWLFSLSPKAYHRFKAGLLNLPKRSRTQHIFTYEQYYFSREEIKRFFTAEISHHDLHHAEVPSPSGRVLDAVESQSWFDIHMYLVDDLLTKIDRASMAYGLEARVPYLDNELFAFAINVHSDIKLKNNQGKFILKKILEKYLPRTICERPKWGFAPPLRRWLRNELRPMVDEYLSSVKVRQYGIVNFEFVQKLKENFMDGSDYLFNKIWLLTLLHKWLSEKA